MKKTIMVLGVMLATLSNAQEAEIVNGFDGFETWVNGEVGELPEHWDGFNKNVIFGGMPVGSVECVTKNSNDPYEGQYSLKIESTSIMGGPAVPGIVTVGSLDIDWSVQDGDVTGGEAYSQLPQELSGQFKFAPVGADTGFVSVWFLENGEQVGGGRFEFLSSTTDWTEFSVDIQFEAGASPDSVNIMFSSTKQSGTIPVGTVLEIDAITFSSFLSISEEKMGDIKCFPVPASDVLNVEIDRKVQGTLEIYSMNGEFVSRKSIDGHSVEIDVSAMKSGTYILLFRNKTSIFRRKIIID